MSTKNLARTVIEGGRTNYAKELRRETSRSLRIDNRRFCKRISQDPESWYAAEIPLREPLYLWKDEIHADKVKPCERFLISRAGRSWNEVHSEICARFDRRKLAGWHVTNCHLLASVEDSRKGDAYAGGGGHGGYSPITNRFWIDHNGIFRYNPRSRY